MAAATKQQRQRQKAATKAKAKAVKVARDVEKAAKAYIEEGLSADVLTLSEDGVFVAKWSYFYTNGQNAQQYAEGVQRILPYAKILGSGNHYHSFVRNAKVGGPCDSYFWVRFTI